jgi:Myotubularin-like phosphatase domain
LSTKLISDRIHQMPVLLHCSHGWDRTSQVAVLAQLLLDPYYRTMAGFSCLVEKDFMSFGHPFHTRCGHGEGRDGAGNAAAGSSGVGSTLDEGQISPIFMQFLDCVFQLVRLYPECFEFNTKYLLCLSEHVYSCRFGNFLCDTERERELVAGIRQRTHSIWDYLDNRTDTVNLQYSAETAAGVLLMPLPTLMRNISLWTDRHCMHGPKPTTRWLPLGVERAVHPLINDQPSDLVTEQETQQLILSMPRTHVRTPLNATTEQPQEQAPPVESANNTLNGDSETPSS